MFPSFHVFGTKVRQFPRTAKVPLINLLFWREWNLPLAKFLSVENNKPLKDLRTVWMIGFQEMIYYLCCSLFLLFRQSFISVAGCRFKPSRWIGKGFGTVYSPTEEESSCKWEQSQVYLGYAECSRVSVNSSKRFTAWPFLILNEVWLPLHPSTEEMIDDVEWILQRLWKLKIDSLKSLSVADFWLFVKK